MTEYPPVASGDGAARRAEAARLEARIRELHRHLVELPPHHGAGGRDTLAQRIGELEAKLRRLQEERRPARAPQVR